MFSKLIWNFHKCNLNTTYTTYTKLHALVSMYAKQNTLGIKKVRGQSEAALQTGATKNFDIS